MRMGMEGGRIPRARHLVDIVSDIGEALTQGVDAAGRDVEDRQRERVGVHLGVPVVGGGV